MNIQSCAKLNLGLKVTGKRDDGFHDILSVFQEIDLADEMHLASRADGKLRVTASDASVPDGRENLVYAAADRLRESVGRRDLGADVAIRKAIPVGGGLGGGSGNAGRALTALNALWGLGLDAAALDALAASVGSDVPFFLRGGTAVVAGRGETITPIAADGEVVFVLAFPGMSVPTPWAFGKLNMELTPGGPYIRFLNSVRSSGQVNLLDLMQVVENDFLPVVSARFPSLKRILAVIRDGGALCASMTGTGATLFGGFEREADARLTVDRLQDQGYRACLSRPVAR